MTISDDTQIRLTLTVEEAAKALGICRDSAYAAVKAGTLPSLKFGRRLLVPRAALERLISATGPAKDAEAP